MRGFTLVETMVVVAIVVTAGVALMGSIQYFYRSNAYILEQTAALESARRGHAFTLQNIREASYGDDGSYLITDAQSNTITFYADIDKDGGIERIRAYLSNGTLYRGITNSTGNPATYTGQPETIETIAVAVRNTTPIFRYYGADGLELTSPIDLAEIVSVGVRLDVDLNPTRAPNVFTLSGTATMRNLPTE
ncbi:MAG TPA: type II secretion system protein [Candidatus Paceibacterota bacterium]|nr:type II secretion system protein [Candidatus Paceibacterota bacterium]